MDAKQISEVLKKLKEETPKKKFNQSIDLIINLKNLNLKNPDEQIEFFAHLHNATGKKVKVCALVAQELEEEAKKICDLMITQKDFEKLAADKKQMKKLAKEYDFFIAQANIMAKVAGAFGRVLGPRGKMPNPKAGCVVPPKANLKPLYDNLQKTIKISAKKDPLIQCRVGKEDMDEAEVIDNIMTIYDQLIHHLPTEKNNIKSIFIKFTMSKPVKI